MQGTQSSAPHVTEELECSQDMLPIVLILLLSLNSSLMKTECLSNSRRPILHFIHTVQLKPTIRHKSQENSVTSNVAFALVYTEKTRLKK